MPLRAEARVNLAAIERNVGRLRAAVGERVALCAVVKADAYGHGAVPAAIAALAGGATWLGVAAAHEAAELRAAGIRAPVLVMGALSDEELDVALQAGADIVAWRADFVAQIDRAARVHVKLDTGMGRLGTRDPDEATRVADAVAAAPQLQLIGAMTHFATADEPGDDFLGEQLQRFAAWAQPLRERHPGLLVHAANSAAALREPAARFDLVRAGIAVYGMDPFHHDPADHGLEPALELRSYVAELKQCAPGESAGYGRRFVAREATTLATVPIGYGDGVRRALTIDADLLVRGRRAAAARHGQHGQPHARPRSGRGRRAARRRGRAARRAGRRARPGRGVGAAAGHDQLRGDVRHQSPGAARVPSRRGPAAVIEALRDALGDHPAWLVGGAVRDRLLDRVGPATTSTSPSTATRAPPPGGWRGPRAAPPSSCPTSLAPGAWSGPATPGRSTSRRWSGGRSSGISRRAT